MTWEALAAAIAAMSLGDREKPACVWPPNACPAAEKVLVKDLVRTPLGDPVLSTGKKPAGVEPAGVV